MRERRSACSAVALTAVSALRLPPHKLTQLLDPLTLRLLGRLRPQLGGAAADALLSEASAAAARAEADGQHRDAVLATTFGDCNPSTAGRARGGSVPATLLRDSIKDVAAAAGVEASPQRSPRHHQAARSPSPQWTSAYRSGACGGAQPLGTCHQSSAASSRAATPAGAGGRPRSRSSGGLERDAELPRGLTESKCEGLPNSESVQQLVAAIRDLDAARREAAAADAREAAAAASRLRQGLPAPPGAGAGPGAAALMVLRERHAAAQQQEGLEAYTDLLESACVAVIDLVVPDGQQPAADDDSLPTAIDDAVATFVAISHDAGLRLIRWGAARYVLLCELTGGGTGGGRHAAVRVAAGCVSAMQWRFAGIVSKAACPHMRFCAGLALGTCFLESVGEQPDGMDIVDVGHC